MREEFEPRQYDSRISSIAFIREKEQPSIKIVAHNKEKAIELEGEMLAAQRIYDMDPPKDLNLTAKQNFEVECDEATATLILSGNLFNAFSLLRSRKLISAEFAEIILKQGNVKEFLENTKKFVIQISSEESEESPRTALERATSLQKEYLAALMELQPDELRQTLAKFADELAEKGKDLLEVKGQHRDQNNSPKVH